MSEEAIHYLRLLGEKNLSSLRKIYCMHLGFKQEYFELHGCRSVQPCIASEDRFFFSETSFEEPHPLKSGAS